MPEKIFSDWGVTVKPRHPEKDKPLFSQSKPLTVNEREAKDLIKKEKKRVKDLEKFGKKQIKVKAQRKKRWQRSYKFNRKSPLAKRLRRLF